MSHCYVLMSIGAIVLFMIQSTQCTEVATITTITDCKESPNAAFDFTGVKVSKDQKSIKGKIVTKKDVKETKVTVSQFITKSGKKEMIFEATLNYCSGIFSYYIQYGILKQGLGDSCPIKQGTRTINLPLPPVTLDQDIIVGTKVEFPDKSCFQVDIAPKKRN